MPCIESEVKTVGNKEIQGQGRLSKRVKVIEGEEYRIVEGYPLDALGDIVCPRCDAGIREIKDEVTIIQYAYLKDMDKYQYGCKCNQCGLRFVWSDEVKS